MKPFESNYRKVKLPKSAHAEEEFGGGKKGILICEKCNIFYYQKAWHHNADAFIAKRENKDLPVKFVLCPACKMAVNHQFEGRLIVSGVPANLTEELLNLIKGYGQRAREADPLDRVLEVKKTKDSIMVTTTENQLANKLAKKIKDTFNKVKTKSTFSKDPSDFVDIRIEFLAK